MADQAILGNFAGHQPGLTSPATRGVAVTPTNGAVLSPTPRALWIGGAGNVYAKGLDGVTVGFIGVQAGTLLPFMAQTVESTSTTATSIVALS